MSKLIYDPASPSGLMRRGKVAGYKHSSGYWVVRLNNVKYYSHRLVWEMHNDTITGAQQIDHRDGDKSNNEIGNLRLVSAKINARNLPMYKTNTSGVTCVFHREIKGKSYWIARWRSEGSTKERHFSCNKYGESVAKQLAIAKRNIKLMEEGSNYTDRHGRVA